MSDNFNQKTSKNNLWMIPVSFLIMYFLLLIIGVIYFPEWIWINMHSLAAWTAILTMISIFVISVLNIPNKKLNEEENNG